MDILSKIKKKKDICVGCPISSKEVQDAEIQLGCIFAPEYNKYVTEFGCIAYDGHELTGITPIKRLNVVQVTYSNREVDMSVPKNWYVIEELHIDGIVAWQDSYGNVYLKSPTTKAKKICGSLCEYLEM